MTYRPRILVELAVVLIVSVIIIAASQVAESRADLDLVETLPPASPGDLLPGAVPPDRGAGEPVVAVLPVTVDLAVHPVPLDIPGDCSVDVTGALNAWLSGVPNGSQIVFPPRACYWVEGSLTLTRRENLLIEGNGAVFRATSSVGADVNRAQWHLDYGVGLVLRNMKLSGANPNAVFGRDTGYDHNIFIRGSSGVLIDGVSGGNTYGDFVAVAHGKDYATIPQNITVINSRAENVGRMGVSCVACDGLTVQNSVFDRVALHVFNLEVEGDDWPGRNVRIIDNTVGSHGWAFFSLGTPFVTQRNDISNIYIAGNEMTEVSSGWCEPAVSLMHAKTWQSDVVVESNTLMASGTAVLIRSTSGVRVAGNELRRIFGNCGDESPAAVNVSGSSAVDVRGNEFAGYATEVHVDGGATA